MSLQIKPAGAPAHPSTDPSPFANKPGHADCGPVTVVLWPQFPVATGGPVRILNATPAAGQLCADVSSSVMNETTRLPSGVATI